MSAQLAVIAYSVLILGLFWLARDPESKTSKALWIPVLYLLLSASRPVSQWLAMAGIDNGIQFDSPDQYLDGSPIDRSIYIGFLVLGLIVLFKRRAEVGVLLRENLPILLFFVYCLISISWSDYSFVALKRWTKAACDVLMVLIVLTDAQPRKALKRFLLWPVFILAPLSILFIKYYPELGREYNRWTWLPIYCGVTENKNELGVLCLVFGLVAVWGFLSAYRQPPSRWRIRHLFANSIVLAMILWLFVIADSMTSLGCFLIGAVVIFLVQSSVLSQHRALVHVLIVTVVIGTAIVLFSGDGGGMLHEMGRDPTLTGRTAIWQAVLSVSGSPLVGTGFESFWLGDRIAKIWEMTMKGLEEAHNGYLEVYLNLGWIGIGLLAILIAAAYRNATRTFSRDSELGSLLLGLITIVMIYNFTEAGFRMTTLTWICLLVTSIAGWRSEEPVVNSRTSDLEMYPVGQEREDRFSLA